MYRKYQICLQIRYKHNFMSIESIVARQRATSEMGFGGVGNSGMGSYHGKKSFKTALIKLFLR